MSRNAGQYDPGVSGNPKGRPRKQPLEISARKNRDDFFAAADMPVWITENGKRKKISARVAINRQLIRRAVEGDMRAILECKKAENRYTFEYLDEQVSALETYLKLEKFSKESPEEMTERLLQVMRDLRALLGPGFQP